MQMFFEKCLQQKSTREKQKLYLLEIIIEELDLNCLGYAGIGKNVLHFEFSDIGPFKLDMEDRRPKRGACQKKSNIKTCTSCLFSLTPAKAEKLRETFVVICDVYRQIGTHNFYYGTCLIPLMSTFEKLLHMIQIGGKEYYSDQCKDKFVLNFMDTDEVVGCLEAYIRLSCFNELVLNEFQGNAFAKKICEQNHYVYMYKYFPVCFQDRRCRYKILDSCGQVTGKCVSFTSNQVKRSNGQKCLCSKKIVSQDKKDSRLKEGDIDINEDNVKISENASEGWNDNGRKSGSSNKKIRGGDHKKPPKRTKYDKPNEPGDLEKVGERYSIGGTKDRSGHKKPPKRSKFDKPNEPGDLEKAGERYSIGSTKDRSDHKKPPKRSKYDKANEPGDLEKVGERFSIGSTKDRSGHKKPPKRSKYDKPNEPGDLEKVGDRNFIGGFRESARNSIKDEVYSEGGPAKEKVRDYHKDNHKDSSRDPGDVGKTTKRKSKNFKMKKKYYEGAEEMKRNKLIFSEKLKDITLKIRQRQTRSRISGISFDGGFHKSISTPYLDCPVCPKCSITHSKTCCWNRTGTSRHQSNIPTCCYVPACP